MNDEELEIRDIHSAWLEAVNSGDLVRLLALMATDAVFLSPGQPPVRRDAFSSHFSDALQRARVHCTSDLEEVVVCGQVAFTRSRDTVSVAPRMGGDALQLAGHRITIYRRQDGGRWLLTRDAHTLTPRERD